MMSFALMASLRGEPSIWQLQGDITPYEEANFIFFYFSYVI